MSVYSIKGGGLTYYGSTTDDLCRRKANHLHHYKLWLKSGLGYCSSFEVLRHQPTFTIIEVCENYKERERWYIENNECINIQKRPIITDEERKEWYKNQYKMKYYAPKKEWYEKNRDKILEIQNQRYECECGSNIRLGNKSIHFKSQKHLRYLENKQITL